MIRLLERADEPLLFDVARGTRCLGPRIAVDWAIARDNPRMPYRFYEVGEGAVIELTGRGSVICGLPEDPGEAALFLRHSGVGRCISDGWWPEGWARNTFWTMMRPASPAPAALKPAGFAKEPTADEVLAVLESSVAIQPQSARDGFYADLCARRNRGLAVVYGQREAENLVSTAGVYALTDWEAYLACVETVPAARRKGYAGRLVELICARFCDRDISLMCEPGLFRFYTPYGFKIGQQSILMAVSDEKAASPTIT